MRSGKRRWERWAGKATKGGEGRREVEDERTILG